MTTPSLAPTLVRAEFEALIADIRPELHRYAARMIGSVVDGEDVVQEALAKAYSALPTTTSVANMRGWLFRIAHNKAIDYLRRSSHEHLEYLDDYPLLAEPDLPLEEQELVAVALSVFLKLPPKQRSCMILKDVLGYSLADISELLDATVGEIKAALHRGRARLRELSESVSPDAPAALDEHGRQLLARYIERFNARDFDAVRAMLADEVRLDVINRATYCGAAEVVPILQAHAKWHEEHRRLHDEAVEALVQAGVFKLLVPERYGGYECDARTLVEVLAELGQADGSSAWLAWVLATSTWLVGLFPDAVQDEVFATPDVRVSQILSPTATAKRRDGGFVVNGESHFHSGALHSQWSAIAAMSATPEGGPEPVVA
jgi:RNA polymerase sigma-70 factor, ECF subfamily